MAGVVGLWRVPKTRGAHAAVKGVPSAERALAVLTSFRQGDGALSLAELAERTGFVKSTIMRLTLSLQQYQLLARLPDGRYRLDAGVLRLGATYQQAFNLEDQVVPVLKRLAAETGETATFYVRHGEDRLCLFRIESASPIRMRVQPGDIRPMDGTAIAKTLRRYEAGPARDGADKGVVLYTSGVSDPHTAALATPIFGVGPSLIGAIAIAGPATRLTPERAQSLKELLAECGTELTQLCTGIASPAKPHKA